MVFDLELHSSGEMESSDHMHSALEYDEEEEEELERESEEAARQGGTMGIRRSPSFDYHEEKKLRAVSRGKGKEALRLYIKKKRRKLIPFIICSMPMIIRTKPISQQDEIYLSHSQARLLHHSPSSLPRQQPSLSASMTLDDPVIPYHIHPISETSESTPRANSTLPTPTASNSSSTPSNLTPSMVMGHGAGMTSPPERDAQEALELSEERAEKVMATLRAGQGLEAGVADIVGASSAGGIKTAVKGANDQAGEFVDFGF